VHRSAVAPRVHIRADDPSVTPYAGLLLTGELLRNLNVVNRLSQAIDGVAPFKERRRGLGGGELLVALAEMMLIGGNHLAHLDVLRQDEAGAPLRCSAVAPPPSTAGQLLRRLTPEQCHAAIAAMAGIGNEFDAYLGLDPSDAVSLDLDASRTEVYGRKKEGARFNYEGRRGYDSQLITWAERQRTIAGELLADNAAPSLTATALLRRALATLPQGHGEVRLRGDSDYYTLDLLHACRQEQVVFAVSVPRSTAMWRSLGRIGEQDWRPAVDMARAEVAETSYCPQGWRHEPLRLLVRRVRVDAAEISHSPRARRRRTIPKAQLALAVAGDIDTVYSYSFVISDLPGEAVAVELWQRQRAHIEERIRDLKLGCGLFHLPLGTVRANAGWQVATVVTTNLMAMLAATVVAEASAARDATAVETEEVADAEDEQPAYRTSPTLRRWMIAVPGRLVHRARRLHLRLPQCLWWAEEFTAAYDRLRGLAFT
jgi:hypothetical protein